MSLLVWGGSQRGGWKKSKESSRTQESVRFLFFLALC